MASPPKTTFHVIRFGNQTYAEIEPKFILEYWKDLRRAWHILDKWGNENIIHYNENFDHPLIIGGWNILTDFARLPNFVDVHFGYFGYRSFEILSYRNLDFTTPIRAIHSRSTHNRCTKFYDITLTDSMLNKTSLVESLDI
ncbi:hypothetical protein QL285_059104 [Trifolium repens]|nr:hypothetical protein QL285_059104 [Trifolium repens]